MLFRSITVPEAVHQLHSQALAALWQSAQNTANESLRAAQAGWEAERAEADTINKQLGDAYDGQGAELDAANRRIDELTGKYQAKQQRTTELAQQIEETRNATLIAENRAAIAEQRRREQAAREARERKLAFERGLRTETVANIEQDNTEGEDLQVRRAAVNALGNHAGTVVVMEAKTGKLLTVVNQDWAIKEGFKPCSTIKLVTGAAGLNEDVINDEGGIGESCQIVA